MSTREQQVLTLIREDPMTPQQAIAERLGMSRSAVAAHIMNLTQKGLIKGRGYILSDSPFVAIVGGANLDIHGRSKKKLRQRDSNPGDVHISAGGVARNIAENLARLGADSRLVSAVGADQHGQLLTRLSREAGIDVRHMHTISSAKTSTYISVVDDDGDMLLGINDMGIVEMISVEMLQNQAAMLKQASLVVVDSNLHSDTLAWLFDVLNDVPIFADAVSVAKAPRLLPHLEKIHTLKAGANEVEALLGSDANNQTQIVQAAVELHARGVARVFITRGEKGVYFSDGASSGARAASGSPHDVRNAGGAGDAFLAGLAYSWLQSWDIDESINFSLATAELTLAHPGTNNPALSLARVQQAMEQLNA